MLKPTDQVMTGAQAVSAMTSTKTPLQRSIERMKHDIEHLESAQRRIAADVEFSLRTCRLLVEELEKQS
jgi:hypothetical protein